LSNNLVVKNFTLKLNKWDDWVSNINPCDRGASGHIILMWLKMYEPIKKNIPLIR
jgi:hypothetical protein